MKKTRIILLLVCCYCTLLQAQQSSFKNFFYSNIKGNTIVAAPKVITHIAPSVGAAIDDSLLYGTPVKVLMLVPYSESINGIEVPWAKCIYKKGEFNKVTFILANELALATANSNQTEGTISFSNANSDSIFFSIQLRNKNNNFQYLKNIGFEKQLILDSFNVQLISPFKLQNVANIFNFQIFSNEVKHSLHFIECSTNNEILGLEKVSINYDRKALNGKVWEFPSTKKIKKNNIQLVTYTPNEAICNIPTKLYKIKNCSLQ
jgi:hypothetical protein